MKTPALYSPVKLLPREIVISPFALGDTPFTFLTVPFKSKASFVAVLIGFAKSVVLLTLGSPTIVALIPETIPVKIGEARGAFKFNAA